MARRRMIDPKFWGDETIAKLSIEERLFYIGLFSLADDMGRICGSPVYLRSQIYPYNDIPLDKVVTWIQHLQDLGLIHVYEDTSGDGNKYIDHPKWLKYQRLDNPCPSLLPACPHFRSHWRKLRTILKKTKNDSQNDSHLKEVKGSLERKGKEVKGENTFSSSSSESQNQNPFKKLQDQVKTKTVSESEKTKTQSIHMDNLKKQLKDKLNREPTYAEIMEAVKNWKLEIEKKTR